MREWLAGSGAAGGTLGGRETGNMLGFRDSWKRLEGERLQRERGRCRGSRRDAGVSREQVFTGATWEGQGQQWAPGGGTRENAGRAEAARGHRQQEAVGGKRLQGACCGYGAARGTSCFR